jgi:hypothetical protein
MPYGYHTLLVSNDGLLAFGGKPQWEGDMKMPDVPHQVPWVGPPLIKVDWGRSHSLLLDSEGGVWEAGTSGVENSEFTSNFRRVEGLPEITQISAGYDLSAVIDTEGNLWFWSGFRKLPPQQISLPTKVLQVAGAWSNLIVEGEDGALWYVHLSKASEIVPIIVEGISHGPLRSLCVLLYGALLVDAEGSVFFSVIECDAPDHERFRFRKLEIPPMVEASSGSANFLLLDEKRQLWKHDTHDSEAMVTEWLEKVDSFVSGGYHFMVHLLDGRTMMYGNNHWYSWLSNSLRLSESIFFSTKECPLCR